MKHEAPIQAVELPRLFRYVPAGALPDGDKLLAVYDRSQNLLIINKDLFDTLNDRDKRIVWRTQSDSIVLISKELVEKFTIPVTH